MALLLSENDVSVKILRVIGLAWQGFTDPGQIALIAGVSSKYVTSVFESKDDRIRHALRHGIGHGAARLEFAIRCDKCRAMIDRVPCVRCTCEMEGESDERESESSGALQCR